MAESTLLEDLQQAEQTAALARAAMCPACMYLESIEDEATRNAMRAALAGTIGRDTLIKILHRHNADFGRRTLERHRREEHA